jgi:hypothetical protein
MKNKIITVCTSLLFIATAAGAHQPRIPQGTQIDVPDPEVSKAYYGKLAGAPHVYTISSEKPFQLYVNILVPDLPGQKRDLSVAIVKDGDSARPLAVLDGAKYDWTRFFEEFGHDTYWMGPEYKAQVSAGTYRITVFNPGNNSKYSLAIGEKELFDLKETRSALTLIPQIKRGFFEESPADFILSPFGWGLILLMYLLAFGLGLIYRQTVVKTGKNRNTFLARLPGNRVRMVWAAAGAGLFIWAITTTWNPWLLLLSGLGVFGAVFHRDSLRNNSGNKV